MGRFVWLGLALVGGVGVTLGACEFPTFEYRSPTTTTTTTSSLGGAGGTGGSSAGGSGGTGGVPNGCGPSQDVCTPLEKCSVVDPLLGTRGCVEKGPRPEDAHCLDDAECDDGLWCDVAVTGVCRRVCDNGNDCDAGAQCVPATSGGVDIPGLEVCTSHCGPTDTGGCVQTFGATNCLLGADGDFTCASTANANVGTECVNSMDCAAGLLCVQGSPSTCEAWCTPVGQGCGGINWCYALTPKVMFDGTEYGVCLL
ncbi:MAG: hypothetical protein IT373_21625 [Polyangiaceae bacterium]|nr:hypothetical protein [Polyangiaceae bacterium]